MFGYSRGRWALLTGAGAVLVALLMVGSSAASATGAAVTVSPGYKGFIEPANQISESGCGAKATLKHFKFSLHTGTGTGAATGKAGNCGKKAPKGFESYSDAYGSGGFQPLMIKLPKVSATTSNISANLNGKWTVSGSASNGGTWACNAGLYTYSFDYTIWEWNWTGSYFSSFAENYSYHYGSYWYNYTYNVAAVPSPFYLNSTTYYYHDADSYTYGDCDASVSAGFDLYGYLYDVQTGYSTFYSGSNAPYYSYSYVDVENYTDWGWYNYTEWYGPYNYSYSTPTTTYSYNATESYLYSYTYSYSSGYTFTSSTGTNSTQPFSNVTKLAGTSMWWTGTFSTTNQYYVEIYLYLDASAYNDGWSKGSASFVLNMATAGNGFKVSSITLT